MDAFTFLVALSAAPKAGMFLLIANLDLGEARHILSLTQYLSPLDS